MKNSIKSLFSIFTLFTLVGCGSKVSSSSSINKTSSSSTVILTKEEKNEKIMDELESKMEIVESKVDEILSKDLVSYELNTSEKTILTLISEEETTEIANSEGSAKSISNIDMIAGKAYYDEYNARTTDEEDNTTWNKELVASIAKTDTSSSYTKGETINHLVDENEEKYTYSNSYENWTYPDKRYDITIEEYDPSDYGVNETTYEITTPENEEDFYFNHYLPYYAITEGQNYEFDSSETEDNIFVKFFNKEATSREVVDYLEESYDDIVSEIPEDFDIGLDFIKDENYQNMMILVLNEIQDIEYYSLYESNVEVNANKETYTFTADLDAIIDTFRDIVDAFERGLSFIPEEDENKETLSLLLDMIKDDLKNRVPTLFDVSMKVYFENDMITGYDSTIKVEGLLPYSLGIFVFGASDLEVLDNTTINVDMETSTSFTLGNNYINIPSVDESKFN